MIVGALANERRGERAQRGDGATARPEIVEHAPHEAIGHALAPHGGVGLDVGHDDGVAVEVVVGDRHDAIVDDEFVAVALGVVPHDVVDLVAWLDHRASLAASRPGNVDGSAARTP